MNMVNITPINYEIEFEPLFHNFTFNGTEIITLDISKPTNLILLDAAELKIKKSCILVEILQHHQLLDTRKDTWHNKKK